MKYIKVRWKHEFEDEPIWLYSELDANRMETRKVEVFKDGTCGFDDGKESTSDTFLGELPVPDLGEIGEDPQFEPCEISREEFENVWSRRLERQQID